MAPPSHRRAAAAALIAFLALLVSGCGSGTTAGTAAADTDRPAAAGAEAGAGAGSAGAGADVPAELDFTAETVGGDAFAGADLAGKPTVVWFWAPWCPTCRAQITGVGELAETHGDDVHVVGVGALDEREAIEQFAADVSPDVTLLADPDGAVWRHFGVTAQSTYLVLDESGEEVASGYLDDAELMSTVEELAG